MRRLLFTTSTLPRFAGDPEPRFVLDLAHALSERYEVTILAPGDAAAKPLEQDGRVTIRRYRYAPLRWMERLAYPGAILPRLRGHPWLWATVPMLFLGLYWALRRLKPGGFDLVHCHWLIPQGVVQALGFAGDGMPPFVVTSHGGDLTSFRGPSMRRLFRLVMERAAATTLVSAALRKEVGELLAGAAVIPMGVDLQRFHPGAAEPGRFGRWCCEERVLLFVGRLVEKKGLDVLLRALAEPAMQATNAHLVVVGEGPLKAQLETRRDALGLRGRVHFLPPVGHAQLPGWTVCLPRPSICVASRSAFTGFGPCPICSPPRLRSLHRSRKRNARRCASSVGGTGSSDRSCSSSWPTLFRTSSSWRSARPTMRPTSGRCVAVSVIRTTSS